jgi:DNA-binding PadR family transcriptional regulator
MTVRDALMGILTLGPAYGLQLHHELAERAPHRQKTNVGQIYGTLERLSKAGLVVHRGLSEDGLPLYALTEAGKAEAIIWLEGSALTTLPEWSDVQDVVLISSSVSEQHSRLLLMTLKQLLEHHLDSATLSPAHTLNKLAQLRYREAVSAWLADVQAAIILPQPTYALGRPKRGRPTKNPENPIQT